MKNHLQILFLTLCTLITFLSACDDSDDNRTDTDSATTGSTDSESASDSNADSGDSNTDIDTNADVPTDSDSATSVSTDSQTDTDSTVDTATATESVDTSAGTAAFGETCVESKDCLGADAVCTEFGQLGFVCTLTCETADVCPDGSQGQKCNNQGFCRP